MQLEKMTVGQLIEKKFTYIEKLKTARGKSRTKIFDKIDLLEKERVRRLWESLEQGGTTNEIARRNQTN